MKLGNKLAIYIHTIGNPIYMRRALYQVQLTFHFQMATASAPAVSSLARSGEAVIIYKTWGPAEVRRP